MSVPPVSSVYTVDPATFIERMAERLKTYAEINPPKELKFWKTSAAKELPPENPEEFWYVRAASLLRKLAIRKTVGVNRLRKAYSSAQRRGVRPTRHARAAGGIIRRCLQQLEKAGLVATEEKIGRKLTPSGQSLVDKVAHEIVREQSGS